MGVSGGFAAMGLMSAGNAYSQGITQKAQADYTANQFGINQRFAAENAADARARGDIEAGEMAKAGDQNLARQRVAAAATGGDVNSGSALNLQGDTKWQSRMNQITIKNNAWRTAWGYNVQAEDFGAESKLYSLSGTNAMNNSLLTGGMNALAYGVQAGSAYDKYNGDLDE